MDRRTSPRHLLGVRSLVVLVALPLAITASSVEMTTSASGPLPETGAAGGLLAAGTTPGAVTASLTGAAPAVSTALGTAPWREGLGDGKPGDIPWSALLAYQRAADILDEVAPDCGLRWSLLAAVGQVESDHGEVGVTELGDDGVTRPEIFGPQLDGSAARTEVADTDAGEWDGDPDWDRAVGPMQLLPGAWSLIAVDGDGDGTRSPHDMDDAAVAVAVYLCSSGFDLTKDEAVTAALLTYNSSEAYVDQVIAVEAAYRRGDFGVAAAPALSTVGTLLDAGPSRPAVADSARVMAALAGAPRSLPMSARSGADLSPQDTAGGRQFLAQAPAVQSLGGSPTTVPLASGSPTPTQQLAALLDPTPSAVPTLGPTPSATGSVTAAGAVTESPSASGTTDSPSSSPSTATPSESASGGGESPASSPEPSGSESPSPDQGEPSGGGETQSPAPADPTPSDPPPSDPTPADPTPSDPPPSDPSPSEPPPSQEPSPSEPPAEEPSPSGSAEPSPSPDPAKVDGVLDACGDGYCLGPTALDLSKGGAMGDPASGDFDGDGSVETLANELAGLAGSTVTLTVLADSSPLAVLAIDGKTL